MAQRHPLGKPLFQKRSGTLWKLLVHQHHCERCQVTQRGLLILVTCGLNQSIFIQISCQLVSNFARKITIHFYKTSCNTWQPVKRMRLNSEVSSPDWSCVSPVCFLSKGGLPKQWNQSNVSIRLSRNFIWHHWHHLSIFQPLLVRWLATWTKKCWLDALQHDLPWKRRHLALIYWPRPDQNRLQDNHKYGSLAWVLRRMAWGDADGSRAARFSVGTRQMAHDKSVFVSHLLGKMTTCRNRYSTRSFEPLDFASIG